jgi:hypothetical protein
VLRDPACDLHVHSRFSTDSGNYALRRARLGESYTDPERVYRVCKQRGMQFVTISDHNTVEGALRIAHHPDTFVSVEVTTRFADDDVPLHVLVWNLTEEDHRDLQMYRASVVELAAFLRERSLPHGLAHPLYRMGPPLTSAHMERLLLLFAVWEGQNGARPAEANSLACRIAAAASPEYLAKLAERHRVEPPSHRAIGLSGGSDDHGAIDIATTWTQAHGVSPAEFLESVMAGGGTPGGAHGSTLKLAHALGALAVNAYLEGGHELPPVAAGQVRALFDEDSVDADVRHEEIRAGSRSLARVLARASARAESTSAVSTRSARGSRRSPQPRRFRSPISAARTTMPARAAVWPRSKPPSSAGERRHVSSELWFSRTRSMRRMVWRGQCAAWRSKARRAPSPFVWRPPGRRPPTSRA